ncbi:hypothetical protein NB636_05210 [Oxalobacter aliiformigenes]|uniref:hypothetical protein n=1 Tax=Oxalobacter aliiformigenes TaxID=2946593 RepID=UPI0022AEB370|nr:hypothetical protein [Oxalobacter aliiformigenes]WAW00244.1 hypothetical protein NB636_05210 [Oxalobacter aliiformigenes]
MTLFSFFYCGSGYDVAVFVHPGLDGSVYFAFGYVYLVACLVAVCSDFQDAGGVLRGFSRTGSSQFAGGLAVEVQVDGSCVDQFSYGDLSRTACRCVQVQCPVIGQVGDVCLVGFCVYGGSVFGVDCLYCAGSFYVPGGSF